MWRRRDGTTVGQEGHGRRDHIVRFSFGTVRVMRDWNKSLGGNARKYVGHVLNDSQSNTANRAKQYSACPMSKTTLA